MKKPVLSFRPQTAFILSTTLVLTALSLGVSAEDLQNNALRPLPTQIAQGLPPLQGYVVTAPAGTYVMASVQSPISSEYARPGDRFNATLSSDLSSGGTIVLPAGSQLEAQVVSVESARRAGRNGKLDIRFVTAITPSGQRIPISARIQTEDGTGVIKGGSVKGSIGRAAVRTGVGAGAGAALGTAVGAVSGGSLGKGAIYGTAIGGGLGALYAGVKKGEQAVIPAGQPINIVLDAPVTVTPSSSYQQQSSPYQQNYNATPYGQTNPYSGNYYGQ